MAEGEAKPLTAEEAKELAQFDVTLRVLPFLDRHLIFPIFNFLQEGGLYEHDALQRAQLKLLSETNMIDWAIETYGTIKEDPPQELYDRRDVVLQQLESTRERVLPLLEVLENEEKVSQIAACKSIEEVCTTFKLDIGVVDGLVQYAKLQYDCGNYSLSGELLKHYRSMMAQDSEQSLTAKQVSCIWGSLASCILNREYEESDGANTERVSDVIFKINDYLEKLKVRKKEVLLQRAWLLHWTLFPIFMAERVELKLLDFFINEKSMSAISLACPHLFRFVAASLILHQKRLKHLLKDTVWVIQHEAEVYSDPVTRFLVALYVDMDFDEAQAELKKCEDVCRVDYFLKDHWADFQENARLLIFETYCRIHQCINIGMISSKLNMQAEEAEVWIVKLIQSAKLDARIDSEKSRVVMSKVPPSIYQQVIEKTKNLSFRSTMMLSNLEKQGKEMKESKQGDRP
eukprot:TRINITY_DN4308_c0_g1_i2.p1 TRINITY_DN4308_c0_g1~~TRINITY_DN4308_c0_g1_i2.p1  ORF type:complete len:478 (+),score=120.09 TRINITY_DN4308_c0_g1_i2:58-1434(+)